MINSPLFFLFFLNLVLPKCMYQRSGLSFLAQLFVGRPFWVPKNNNATVYSNSFWGIFCGCFWVVFHHLEILILAAIWLLLLHHLLFGLSSEQTLGGARLFYLCRCGIIYPPHCLSSMISHPRLFLELFYFIGAKSMVDSSLFSSPLLDKKWHF
jgi:hypothetical protein